MLLKVATSPSGKSPVLTVLRGAFSVFFLNISILAES